MSPVRIGGAWMLWIYKYISFRDWQAFGGGHIFEQIPGGDPAFHRVLHAKLAKLSCSHLGLEIGPQAITHPSTPSSRLTVGSPPLYVFAIALPIFSRPLIVVVRRTDVDRCGNSAAGWRRMLHNKRCLALMPCFKSPVAPPYLSGFCLQKNVCRSECHLSP